MATLKTVEYDVDTIPRDPEVIKGLSPYPRLVLARKLGFSEEMLMAFRAMDIDGQTDALMEALEKYDKSKGISPELAKKAVTQEEPKVEKKKRGRPRKSKAAETMKKAVKEDMLDNIEQAVAEQQAKEEEVVPVNPQVQPAVQQVEQPKPQVQPQHTDEPMPNKDILLLVGELYSTAGRLLEIAEQLTAKANQIK